MLTRRPFLTAATAIFVIGLAGPTPGLAENEKGPRCSDGIDNDGDGKIDCISGNEDPDCKCGGDDGGGGNQPTPAKITFCNDDPGCDTFEPFEHKIQSDVGPYIDGIPADLKVVIEAAAKQGNIELGGNVRKLRITVPANECGLPTGATEPLASDFDFRFMGVQVNKEVSGGVFGMDEDVTSPDNFAIVPMRIGFEHAGDLYFVKFNFKGPGPCKGKSSGVMVKRTSTTSWTVTNEGAACVEKLGTDTGKADFCFVDAEMTFSFDVELL